MKYLIIIFIYIIPVYLISQNVVNNGNNIIINNGAYLVINGNYKNQTSNNIPGKIDLDGDIIIKGNWINESIENNVLINIEPTVDGTVLMDGTTPQEISGNNPTHFENLSISNSTKRLIVTDNSVNGILSIDAVLDLNSKRIIINNSSPSSIQYKSKYILSETQPSEGYGEVQWNVGANIATYSLPFGSGISSNNDLNLVVSTLNNGVPGNGKFIFATYRSSCDNNPQPTGVTFPVENPSFVADRYWIINADYPVSKPNINIEFNYTSQDINASCNEGIDSYSLLAESFCRDCGDGWIKVGESSSVPGKVFSRNIQGSDCYAPWRLLSNVQETQIFIPDAFTPDNDNLNDVFGTKILNENLFSDYRFIIFDRWGAIAYESYKYEDKWDGKVKGKIAQEGVYTWMLSYKDKKGIKKNKIGKVTLLRTGRIY